MNVIEVYKENHVDDSIFNYTVGEKGVVSLNYHTPMGEGDAHYVDVVFEEGNKIRIFRPDAIYFDKK